MKRDLNLVIFPINISLKTGWKVRIVLLKKVSYKVHFIFPFNCQSGHFFDYSDISSFQCRFSSTICILFKNRRQSLPPREHCRCESYSKLKYCRRFHWFFHTVHCPDKVSTFKTTIFDNFLFQALQYLYIAVTVDFFTIPLDGFLIGPRNEQIKLSS